MTKNSLKISGGKIIFDNKVIENKSLYITNDKITAITEKDLPFEKEIFANGLYVSPGFIDMHVHGGGGFDFLDGGNEAIINAAEFHLKHGTTSIFPTTLACSFETLETFLSDLKNVINNKLCKCNILGAHLEGPYFANNQCGAQNLQYITSPIKKDYLKLLENFGDIIFKWSFAPELNGSLEFCKTLIEHSVVPSIGHSNATIQEVREVYEVGCKSFTHLYSGMSSIIRKDGYRILGVVESAYYFNDTFVEVIADGKHLPPELLSIIINSKTADNVCLVTDAMRAAGQSEGISYLGKKGEETVCIIEDGIAKLPDKTSFAGSVATADRLVRTLTKIVGIDICSAVKMITKTPAGLLNLKNKGELKENYDADVIFFDDNINIKRVIVGGKIII